MKTRWLDNFERVYDYINPEDPRAKDGRRTWHWTASFWAYRPNDELAEFAGGWDEIDVPNPPEEVRRYFKGISNPRIERAILLSEGEDYVFVPVPCTTKEADGVMKEWRLKAMISETRDIVSRCISGSMEKEAGMQILESIMKEAMR